MFQCNLVPHLVEISPHCGELCLWMPASECSEQQVMMRIHRYAWNTNTNTHRKWPKSCFQSDIVSRVLEKKLESTGFWRKKLKFGRVLDFTGGFGLKVRQVSAGFGCREGYYPWKALISAANVMEISRKKYDWTAPWEILMKRWLLRHGQMGGGRWPNGRRRVKRL